MSKRTRADWMAELSHYINLPWQYLEDSQHAVARSGEIEAVLSGNLLAVGVYIDLEEGESLADVCRRLKAAVDRLADSVITPAPGWRAAPGGTR